MRQSKPDVWKKGGKNRIISSYSGIGDIDLLCIDEMSKQNHLSYTMLIAACFYTSFVHLQRRHLCESVWCLTFNNYAKKSQYLDRGLHRSKHLDPTLGVQFCFTDQRHEATVCDTTKYNYMIWTQPDSVPRTQVRPWTPVIWTLIWICWWKLLLGSAVAVMAEILLTDWQI